MYYNYNVYKSKQVKLFYIGGVLSMKILKRLNKRKTGECIGHKDEVAVCDTSRCNCTGGFLNPHDPKDRKEILRALQGVSAGNGIVNVQGPQNQCNIM